MSVTVTQVLTGLQIIDALAPAVKLVVDGFNDLSGQDLDAEEMTVAELLELKSELIRTHPDNWPAFAFKSSKES